MTTATTTTILQPSIPTCHHIPNDVQDGGIQSDGQVLCWLPCLFLQLLHQLLRLRVHRCHQLGLAHAQVPQLA